MKNYQSLLNQIKQECRAPTCMSYEYDPIPTAKERLKNILKLIADFENVKTARKFFEGY